MSRSVKIGILIAALTVLGALAAARFWPSAGPPADSAEYLERELERLQDIDSEDLPPSEQNIKAGLTPDSDAEALTTLFLAELARRHGEVRLANGDRVPPPPPMPAGHNGWPEMEKAGAYAQTVEQAGFQFDSAPGYDVAAMLKASEVLPRFFDALLTYDHITVPPTTDHSSIIPIPGSIARVLCMRVNARFTPEGRVSALAEARAGLHVFSKTAIGPALICVMLQQLTWSVLLEHVVLKPSWTADEMEQLIGALDPPQIGLEQSMLAEARYAQDGGAEPSAGELQDWIINDLLDNHGYLPMNELIEASLRDAELAMQTRLKIAKWAHEHPGDVLNSHYFQQVVDALPESERKLWIGPMTGSGESRALVAAARLKHAWLRGVRGPELATRADTLAAESGFLAATRTDGGYAFTFAPGHPALAFRSNDPLAEISLPE